METKRCCTCKLDKILPDFANNSSTEDKKERRCRSCAKVQKDAWNKKNAEWIKEYGRIRGENLDIKNKEKEQRFEKYWGDETYRKKHLEENRIRRRTEESKIKQRANEKLRRQTNPSYRLRTNLNIRLRAILFANNQKKQDSIIEFIGCSMDAFANHIKSTWTEGMNWDNYGRNDDCWQIDHIKPCCSFDLTNPEQVKLCYHYTNTQALWKVDNLAKGGKLL